MLPTSSDHQRQSRVVQNDIEQDGGEAVIFQTMAQNAEGAPLQKPAAAKRVLVLTTKAAKKAIKKAGKA